MGTILGRYFEIIAEDPEHMLELLGFIEDLKIESISRIIKSYVSTDMILGEGRVVRDKKDFGKGGKEGDEGTGDGEGGLSEGEGEGEWDVEGKGRLKEGDKDLKGESEGTTTGGGGKVVRDLKDFGEDLDKEKEKEEKSREMSEIDFELLWKYKTQRSVRCEASTSDGVKILAGSENGMVYFIEQNANSPWRVESDSSIVDIDMAPDGEYGIFCNSKKTLVLIDCQKEGGILWKHNFGRDRVNAVTISSKGKKIVAATSNFELVFFDIKGKKIKSFSIDDIIRFLDTTKDGGSIIAASPKSLIRIDEGSTPKKIEALNLNENIQSISISSDGEYIAVGTREGMAYLLNSEGSIQWKNDVLNPVYGISVSLDGRVVAGTMNGTMVLYSSKGERIWKYQTGENIWDIDISEDGNRIISGCGLVFGNVYLFRVK